MPEHASAPAGSDVRNFARRELAQRAPTGGRRTSLVRLGGIVLAAASAGTARRAMAGSPAWAAGPAAAVSSKGAPLPRPGSWQALLRDSGTDRRPIVALFSTPGCAYCRLVRHDHLRHLARDAQRSGALVVELSLADRSPFEASKGVTAPPARAPASPAGLAASPAALAASLGIRFAPTVAFFGPEGELAERLVGYASADFYGAYLDDRIATATAALRRAAA